MLSLIPSFQGCWCQSCHRTPWRAYLWGMFLQMLVEVIAITMHRKNITYPKKLYPNHFPSAVARFEIVKFTLEITDTYCICWGGAPDSSFRALSLHPLWKLKNQKIRKSKMEPQKWFPCRDNSGTNHRNRKCGKLLPLKDMRWSEFPWRGNFRDKSQKCFGPGNPEPQHSQSDYFFCLEMSGRLFFFPF